MENFSLGQAPKVAKVKNGNYTVELIGATAPKEAVDRNGVKHPRCMFSFEVVGGKFNGETLTYWANIDVSLTSDKSNLSKMVTALLGKPATTKSLDLSTILHKRCGALVQVAEKEGNSYSNIVNFYAVDEDDEPAATAKPATRPAPAPVQAAPVKPGMTAAEFLDWLKQIGVAPETVAKHFGKPTWEEYAISLYKAGNKDPRRELLKQYVEIFSEETGWVWNDKDNEPEQMPF